MDLCNQCDFEEKILVCCGRYPQNGGQGELQTEEGRQVLCCPHLERSGKCGNYDQRPSDCRSYFCDRYKRSYASSLEDLNLLSQLLTTGDIRETV